MSERTAQNFMNVCSRFGEKPNYLEFKPTVLYALAAPSTPDAVVDKAIEEAETGQKVALADVKTWKAELMHVPTAQALQPYHNDTIDSPAFSGIIHVPTAQAL